ncbi:MAG: MT-A70 family methyltransferase [Rhodomicrobium sp.]
MLTTPRRREHSRKPDETYDRIKRLARGPYLEVFARQSRPGWDAVGKEVAPPATGPQIYRVQRSSN